MAPEFTLKTHKKTTVKPIDSALQLRTNLTNIQIQTHYIFHIHIRPFKNDMSKT